MTAFFKAELYIFDRKYSPEIHTLCEDVCICKKEEHYFLIFIVYFSMFILLFSINDTFLVLFFSIYAVCAYF